LRAVSNILSLIRALEKANCDIYFQSGAGFDTGLVAAYCKWSNKIFVYRAALLWDADLSFSRECGWHSFKKTTKLSYHFGVTNADAIVCNSETIANKFRKQLPNKKIVMIRNGYPIRKLEGPPEKKGYVLWASRLTWYKRPGLLIEIAKRLPNYRFIAVGRGDYDFSRAPRNLHFLGFKNGEELYDLFKHANLFLNTSLVEGFPNTLIESGIYYTPYVTFYDPENIVKNYQLGFQIRSIDEAVQAISELMENPSLRRKMGINIRKYVEENHDIDNIVTEYETLFDELTKRA